MRTKEQDKAYRSTPEYKARARAYMKKFRLEHPGYQAQKDKEFYYRNLDDCRRKGRERYHARTPEQQAAYKERQKRYHLKRKYDMTPESKAVLFVQQSGLCHICNQPMLSCDESVIDHSHYTDDVRGLAHDTCNLQLGVIEVMWHDTPELLHSMLSIAGFVPK